ncbi:MAG TPA: HEAT repeat domain-containing protein [Allosphingosinicella sp.]|jgi:hypothetical protein
MSDKYEPPSEFLKTLIEDDSSLRGDERSDANIRRLIELMRDKDPANRDWATSLLAGTDADTPEVRGALAAAAEDEHAQTRSEAILGIAQRNPDAALPLLQRELAGDMVTMATLEAAMLVAHPLLVAGLRRFASPSDHAPIDECIDEALTACEAGKPPADYWADSDPFNIAWRADP